MRTAQGSLPVPSSCPASAPGSWHWNWRTCARNDSHGRIAIVHAQNRRGGGSMRSRLTIHSSTNDRADSRPTIAIGTSHPVGFGAPVHHAPDSSPAFEIREGTARRSSSNAAEASSDRRCLSVSDTAFDVTNGVFGWNGTARTITPSST
jgi:hypothetical protein